MIIKARLEDHAGGSESIQLLELERADGKLKPLGIEPG